MNIYGQFSRSTISCLERGSWQNHLSLQTAFVLLSTFLACINAQLSVGDECMTASNKHGICRPFGECESAVSSLSGGVRPKICSFMRDVPIVCCPRVHPKPSRPTPQQGSLSRPQQTSTPKRRISEIKCDEYSDVVRDHVQGLPLVLDPEPISVYVPKCPDTSVQLIVGGQESKAGEFPHMTAIGYQQKGSSSIFWNCGGSLISELYVLTAAHCALKRPSQLVVRLGVLNLQRDSDGIFHSPGYLGSKDTASSGDYRISSVKRHPRHNPPAKYFDIALLKLESHVKIFTKLVRPACIYTQPTIRSNVAIATGWGNIEYGGDASVTLLKVALNIIDAETCKEVYRLDEKTDRLPQGIVKSMFCAGVPEGGKDTCQGDSGGPLQIRHENNKCIHYIIGLTSFGKHCGAPNAYGVFTKVSSYVQWIENNVWPSK